jgi:sulfate transport system ATP-binding protein
VTTIFVTHDQEEAMDVADHIVVIDAGRVQQEASPRELYDLPANEFVMSFVGPVNRVGESYIRPHDLDLRTDPVDGAMEALVERVVYLGFEVRVELVRSDGERLWAQVARDEAERLELAAGQYVYSRPRRERVFSAA